MVARGRAGFGGPSSPGVFFFVSTYAHQGVGVGVGVGVSLITQVISDIGSKGESRLP